MNTKERRVDFGETHIFLGARYIVSIRHGSSLSYRDVRSRCESTPRLLGKGVITHAGLGTTMAALGRGVPLLCTPTSNTRTT